MILLWSLLIYIVFTVFENHRKSFIQHFERSELRLHLSGQKLIKNAKNGPFGQVFEKHDACGQTVLPDKSILIGQKLVENAKIEKIQMRHFE